MKHLVGAPWAAQQTEGQLPVYGTGMKIGRAVSANITFQRNESELYADDVLAESDNVLTGGTLDVTVAEILDEVGEAIFGNKKDEDGSYHDSDLASPYIGMGYLREMKLQGKSTYRATWLYKVQLAPAEESANTRGETTTWQTQRMTGEILGVTLDDGSTRFRAWKTFDKAEEATAWLNAKANYQSV
jgi:phi13 family phage major tail protein